MKFWKKLLAFGLLALPAMLSAQWALYNSSGPPHSLLAAPGGGWVVASAGNIFKLSPEGEVVWGQRFDNDYPYRQSAWPTPDSGYMAAVVAYYGAPAMLFKLEAAGNVVWAKTYSLANAILEVFCPIPDGGAFIAGQVDFDLLLCRCSAEGEIVWQKACGTGDVDRATAAAPTSDGGVIVLGSCKPDTWPTTSDLWVLKLTSTGEVEWQKRIGGAADDGAGTVFQTADGGYLIAGHSTSFEADGQSLFWLLKLSAAGTVQRHLTLNYYAEPGGSSMRRAADGSFIAALGAAFGVVVVTIAEDGAIIREKPYSSGLYSVNSAAVWPTDDGGCLLSMTGNPSSDDVNPDSHLLKILPSGEIEWQKVYGSRYSPDVVYLFARAGDGGYILAGATSSWGGIFNALSFMWIMRTTSDGSIGPNYPFVRPAGGSPQDEVSTWIEVAAPADSSWISITGIRPRWPDSSKSTRSSRPSAAPHCIRWWPYAICYSNRGHNTNSRIRRRRSELASRLSNGVPERIRTSDLLITNELAMRSKLLIIKVISQGVKSIVLGLCSPAVLLLAFYPLVPQGYRTGAG